tara:strand:+ start:13901 stop:14338 length:438 start_codon:yes stop_codon:yes gene_type:complete
MSFLIAIDPGSKKCGILLADIELKTVLKGDVVATSSLISIINLWKKRRKIDSIIIGNGTRSNDLEIEIKSKTSIPVVLVEERNTTLRARERYWEIWPKNFFLKLLPDGMVVPLGNLDAIAALLLLEDFLKYKLTWTDNNDFKILP